MEDSTSCVSYICESDKQGGYDFPGHNYASSYICNRIKLHLQQNYGVLMGPRKLSSITIPLRAVKNKNNDDDDGGDDGDDDSSSLYRVLVCVSGTVLFPVHLSPHNSAVSLQRLLSPYWR